MGPRSQGRSIQRSWMLQFWNMPSKLLSQVEFLGGWKRKDDCVMSKGEVCYCFSCPLVYHSKCLMSVVLEKKNSHNAKVHSKDQAKCLKWQQKESIAQAVSVAPLQS